MDAVFRGLLLLGAISSLGASYRTPNFIVEAPSAEFAKQVGDAAEVYRHELAIDWIGKPLPGKWKYPCPIKVQVGKMGAGGKTTFNFQSGEVYGWNMEIQGSEQRILDSVLPHEINHTIFASHFRRPLPRWADEGAASLIEHESERSQLRQIHRRVLGTRRKIPLKTLLEMKQYPQDQQDVLTLYAEGHSLADFLIQKGGKLEYMRLMSLAHDRGWESSLKSLYSFRSLESLENEWEQWVSDGSPKLSIPEGSQVAGTTRTPPETTIRGQSPETGSVADGNLKLGTPLNLVSNEGSDKSKPREVATREVDNSAAAARSRDELRQPLLTISRQTTDAAKVIQD